jgi:hypothetical protein
MPRRNKRKVYSTGKAAVFFSDGGNNGYKPECVGCALAGYGGICKTSDSTCLKTLPERREQDKNASSKQ